jgi:hypothetical protein
MDSRDSFYLCPTPPHNNLALFYSCGLVFGDLEDNGEEHYIKFKWDNTKENGYLFDLEQDDGNYHTEDSTLGYCTSLSDKMHLGIWASNSSDDEDPDVTLVTYLRDLNQSQTVTPVYLHNITMSA